ncbi:FAD-dependent oxidoreductase [Streptomyces viridiviolaceus]
MSGSREPGARSTTVGVVATGGGFSGMSVAERLASTGAVAPYAIVSSGKALSEPHGRIHGAGSETAGECPDTRNGAVLTGRRTAERVVTLLSRDVREGASR